MSWQKLLESAKYHSVETMYDLEAENVAGAGDILYSAPIEDASLAVLGLGALAAYGSHYYLSHKED